MRIIIKLSSVTPIALLLEKSDVEYIKAMSGSQHENYFLKSTRWQFPDQELCQYYLIFLNKKDLAHYFWNDLL